MAPYDFGTNAWWADLSDLGKDPSTSTGPALSAYQSGSSIGWEILSIFAHHKGPSIRLAYADQMMGLGLFTQIRFDSGTQSVCDQDLDPNLRSDWVNGQIICMPISHPRCACGSKCKTDIDVLSRSVARWRSTNTLSPIKNGRSFSAAPSARAILPACISLAWAWYSTHLWGNGDV